MKNWKLYDADDCSGLPIHSTWLRSTSKVQQVMNRDRLSLLLQKNGYACCRLYCCSTENKSVVTLYYLYNINNKLIIFTIANTQKWIKLYKASYILVQTCWSNRAQKNGRGMYSSRILSKTFTSATRSSPYFSFAWSNQCFFFSSDLIFFFSASWKSNQTKV